MPTLIQIHPLFAVQGGLNVPQELLVRRGVRPGGRPSAVPPVILGEPVVLFRTQDGTPVAFEDRCAHRHLPLSMGTLVGDTLQCRYHGLRYDKTGACVKKFARAGTREASLAHQ